MQQTSHNTNISGISLSSFGDKTDGYTQRHKGTASSLRAKKWRQTTISS